MAAILNAVDDRLHEMSGDVGSIISELAMAENINMGVEVGIAAPSITVEKLFPLPV